MTKTQTKTVRTSESQEFFQLLVPRKMNFLKAEIERKRKQLQEKQVVGPDKKYFKRGDLLQKEKDEYFKRHQPKEEDVKNLVEISEAKSKHKEERKSLFRKIIK